MRKNPPMLALPVLPQNTPCASNRYPLCVGGNHKIDNGNVARGRFPARPGVLVPGSRRPPAGLTRPQASPAYLETSQDRTGLGGRAALYPQAGTSRGEVGVRPL